MPGSARKPAPAKATPRRSSTLHVTWITLLTITAAFLSLDRTTEDYLRPVFFLALSVFFAVLGRRRPALRSLPFRLMQAGFLLLGAGTLLAALLHRRTLGFLPPDLSDQLAFGLDRGIGFLLGFALLSYGIVLWVPEILESRRILRRDLRRARARSERKARALRKATEVIARQEALVSVGQLSAGVAHELRNPLAIVKSALERLRGELDAAERQRCFEVMERAIGKANRRIQGLLDLGRAQDYRPRTVDAGDLLRKCADLLRPQAKQAGVEIDCLEPEPDACLWGDPDLLLQVLMNLGRNAIQAKPHQGPIRLGCRRRDDGAVTLTVEDRGCGVAEPHRARLFTPFFTTKADGTGLGLTVSADLIERHGGKLWLEPRRNGGTRFGIDLPGQPAALPPLATEAAHA